MVKMPWAEPVEDFLQPFQGFVTLSLIAVILVTLGFLIKGGPIGRTAWLVWLALP